jgi:hypothetical protein
MTAAAAGAGCALLACVTVLPVTSIEVAGQLQTAVGKRHAGKLTVSSPSSSLCSASHPSNVLMDVPVTSSSGSAPAWPMN